MTGCVPAQPAPLGPVPPEAVVEAAPASSPLEVTGVLPEPNSAAVPFNSAVFVQFNRPVVPLTTLDHPVADDPLQIEPAVAGSGHWINSGLYTFAPEVGWAPSTAYQIQIPRTKYAWSFTTLPPAVASTAPAPSATLVDPAAAVRVTFNQPVDPATARLDLSPLAPGYAEWLDNRILQFRPEPALAVAASYRAEVHMDGVETPYVWRFDTAPEPLVTRSLPGPGTEAPKLGQVELFFSAPMDPDDVRAKLTVEPELDYPPYPRWSDNDTHATIYAPFKPDTEYSLSLPAGTHDRFNRTTAAGFTLSFHTPAGLNSPSAPAVSPQAWLISPGLIGTFNAYAHPRALLRTTNVSHFDFSADALDEAAIVRINNGTFSERMSDGRRVLSGGMDVQFERNVPKQSEIDLGTLAPGYYRLRIEPKETATRVPDHLVVVTRSMVAVKQSASQMLVWATDLSTGQPLANVSVRVLRADTSGSLAIGTTNADGLAQLDIPSPSKTPTLVVVDRPGDATLATSNWSGGVGAWSFGLPVNYSVAAPPGFTAYAYTDRPIYRPGQTVHLKGIVRSDDDARYSLAPQDFGATWQARDSQGRMVSSGKVGPLSDFGTFAADVDLSSEAATGRYTFEVQLPAISSSGAGGVPGGSKEVLPAASDRRAAAAQTLTSVSFTVAEYQRAEFEVALTSANQVVAGQPLQTNLKAAYYFGQPLANASVHWQVSAAPFTFTWPVDPTFRFGDLDIRALKPITPSTNAPRAEGKAISAADGTTTFKVPTTLAADETSQRFTIEATATDADRGNVSNRSSVVVHKAGLYLGLKPTTFVARAGEAQTIELVSLEMEGKPRASVAVHGQVFRRRWLSVRERDAQGELHWSSRPEDTLAGELDAQTGLDGRGSVAFTPVDGGEYRVIVEATDGSGNTARSAISVWVAGPGFVLWRISDDARLELQADKPVYQPGDVAHVIVPAPIANATALVTVERGKLISAFSKELTANSTVLDIPLGAQHVPNAFVSVMLFEGGQSPALFTGYVELSVSSNDHQLEVSLEPDRREHAPGDSVTYTIRSRDKSGRPEPSEVSLALVDAAVLALADSHTDPVAAFWHRRPLGVQTGSSLGASIDRMNESASSGLKGGGGGDAATVRQDFPDTAFWSPQVRTNENGFAQVDVRLPDSLTTWRLSAVAVTRDTQVGVNTTDVITSKQLLLRPLAPRFLVGGDVVTIGAAIHNTTDAAQSVRASLHADGVSVAGAADRSIDVPAGGEARVDWPVSVLAQPGSDAVLHFQAASVGANDAVDLHVPLLAWGAYATVATAGEVAPADTVTETVDVPKEVDSQRGELSIDVAPSLAAALRYSLRQVEQYPYECLEQTVSRFIPRLALARAIDGLGLADPFNLKGDLPGLVSRSIQRVYRFQHTDGGWGWWSDDASSPYLTAYALFGLVEAKRSGFAVEHNVIDRGAAYLRQHLNGDPGVYGLDTRAYALYVLANAGSPDAGRVASLFDRRAELGAVGRAYLTQTLAALDPADARIGGLLSDLTSAAVISSTGSHWEESIPSVKPWIMASDVRTTAAVLDALVRLRPDHPLVQPTVRWLMAARRDEHGYWDSTHDTAQSLLTLTDYLATSGELQGNFEWQVVVEGQTRANGAAAPDTLMNPPTAVSVPVAQLKTGRNDVDLIRAMGPGRLYYTLRLNTVSAASEVPFVSNGFSVGREYFAFGAGPTAQPVGEVHVGDLVQVRVTLMAPTDLHDLVLEDPLPAGLEPLDTRLKTTSRAIANAVQAAQTPGWQPWSHLDGRSDHVALFANYLSRGTYQYTYVARASLAGEFRVLPTNGREQYFPDVFAHGDGQQLTVLP